MDKLILTLFGAMIVSGLLCLTSIMLYMTSTWIYAAWEIWK